MYFYLLLGIIYSSLSKIQEDEKYQEFLDYIEKYNKHYSSKEEFESRFNIWKKNYNKIKRHNPSSFLSFDKPSGATFSLNQFADMSEEEFSSNI